MVTISNISVSYLRESVIACRNAMRLTPPQYTDEEFNKSLPRAKKLAKLGGGSGHSNFRVGIVVQFDIKYSGYFSPELQRYHFLDIVASSSKMHRLTQMDMNTCFNEYVTDDSKEIMKELLAEYNEVLSEKIDNTIWGAANLHQKRLYKAFMRLLSNCPLGIELFMRCTTNYEQLATIYRQRKNHKLREDWGAFCGFIESLPYAHELIICDKQ